MIDMEIWIPELVVVFFLVLPLLRPFVKALWHQEGLQWLPMIGLGIMVGIFPAYGFRPECLPMLFFSVVYNLANVPSRSKDSLDDRWPLFTVCVCLLLAVFAVPMLVFSPKVYDRSNLEFEAVTTVKLTHTDSNYYVRIYSAANPDDTAGLQSPVIFLVPPEIGSAGSVDLVCTELQGKGYTIVTYTRDGYDIPVLDESGRKKLFSPAKFLRYWNIFRKAVVSVSANERGKELETARRADIAYLLPQLPVLLKNTHRSHDLPPLLLAGYGAGGSALAYLAGESDFAAKHAGVLGVMAIESPLWSAYLPERRELFKAPPIRSKFTHQLSDFIGEMNGKLPPRMSLTGPLPEAGLPLLYLISGRALNPQKGHNLYQAVLDSFRSGTGPATLAVIEGAGPLDYQDLPFTHPIGSFFLRGLKGAGKSENPVSDTAAIIGNFASWLLERAEAGYNIPPRTAIKGSLYIESKGMSSLSL